jgi:hypothetical protein
MVVDRSVGPKWRGGCGGVKNESIESLRLQVRTIDAGEA